MKPATTKSAPGTRVYDFSEEHLSRSTVVIRAVSETEKMMVICGPGVSLASGMPRMKDSVCLSHDEFEYHTTFKTAIDEFSTSNVDPNHLREDKLAAFNKLMAGLRIQARSATPSNFHRFLQRAFHEQRVVQCLTENFDGLETQGDVNPSAPVIRMHGDNRLLRCLTATCPGLDAQAVADIDDELLLGRTMACEPCTEAARNMRSQRRAGPPAARFLRPAVQGRMARNLLPSGKLRTTVLKLARNCELLLVVGVSLKCHDTFDLIYDLAARIHEGYGAVVYVDPKPIRGRNTDHCIDFHLQVDIENFSAQLLQGMNDCTADDDIEVDSTTNHEPSDRWYEVMNNDVQPEVALEEPEHNKAIVSSAATIFAILESSTATAEVEHVSCYDVIWTNQTDLPTHKQSKILYVLGVGNMASMEYTRSHYVSPAPQLSVQEPKKSAPRMAMVIYYLDQFWPHARHLCALVSGRWKAYGWSCFVEPRKLEELAPKREAEMLESCTWQAGTFNLFIVYITHGLSESLGYQVSQDSSLAPVDFLDHTLAPLQNIAARARYTCGFLICCGNPFYSAKDTRSIQSWINRGGTFDTLIGCLNQKLSPAFMINMVARITTTVAGRGELARHYLLDCWLGDGIACGHSDLLYMARYERPLMWLFSPFDSRPLGKELPHLLNVCTCKLADRLADDERPRPHRKVWIVSHTKPADRALRNVRLSARCSMCSQAWVLPTEHMDGYLYDYGGLYAAIVPYFTV